MVKPSTVDGFMKLDSVVSIYRPPNAEKQPASDDGPRLIVLCSWMAAAPKHIAKYTTGYQRLFPNASILLIESTVHGAFFGADIPSACEILHSYVEDGHGSVVLHMFSNGGATNATNLAVRYTEKYGDLPFDNIILDSCPAAPELNRGTRAVTFALPNQYFVRLVGSYMIYFGLGAWLLVNWILGIDHAFTIMRRRLNDTKIFNVDVGRLYLYSRGDELVTFENVQEHIAGAREAGCKIVRDEMFQTSQHCALLNEDSTRYWNAVKTHVLGDDERIG